MVVVLGEPNQLNDQLGSVRLIRWRIYAMESYL